MNVIDANCWCDYVTEWLAKAPGVGSELFAKARQHGGMLFDLGGHMRQQYIDMKKPYAEQIFNIFAEEMTISGSMRMVDLAGKSSLHKELSGLGLPSKEHVYFRVAVHGGAKYILSQDIDFFDPGKKKAAANVKAKAVAEGRGPVCKHMAKAYKVTICCPAAYVNI